VTALTNASNNFDRVTILGRLLQWTAAYVSLPPNTVPERYTNAVKTLDTAVRNDLNEITGGVTYQTSRNADIVALRGDQPALTPKQVSLNIFYLVAIGAAPGVGPIDVTIDNHITQANNAVGYRRARITFARTNAAATLVSQTPAGDSILLSASSEVPARGQGKFADGGVGGPRLITYCNASGGAPGSIDVVYLDHYDQLDVQGRTFRAGKDYGAATPNRPIVTVTLSPPAAGSATQPTTLAHELGHALTGDPDHSLDASCLMAGGAIRNANDTLSDGLVGWFRNNPWT
jgi:hypothetical protein